MAKPFDSVLIRYFQKREQIKTTVLFLPWLIADMLGVAPSTSFEQLLSPWLLLHSYILIVDDLTRLSSPPQH